MEKIFCKESRTILLLAAISFFLFLVFLGRRPLWAPDEIRIAGIGANMLLAHEWVVPLLNGKVFLEKPPLYFLSVAGTLKFFGFTPFAAKLPSALSAIMGVIGLFLLSRSLHFSRHAAFCSSAVLALSIQYFITGRRCITDIMLTSFVIWSIYASYNLLKKECRHPLGWSIILTLVLSGGILTKGLVALVILFGTVLPWYAIGTTLSVNNLLRKQNIFFYASLVLAVSVLGIWIYFLCQKTGAQGAYEVLWKNNFGRFFGEHRQHVEPSYYYLKKLPEQLAPWMVFMPLALFFHAKEILLKKHTKSILMVSWLVIPFLILSLSSAKRPIYLLPIHPAAALVVGTFIDKGLREQDSWFLYSANKILFFLLALTMATAASLFLRFLYIQNFSQSTALVPLLAVPLLSITATISLQRESLAHSIFLIFASLLLLFLSWDAFGSNLWRPQNSLRPLFSYVAQIEAGKKIVLFKPDEALRGGVVFYLKKIVPEFYDQQELLDHLKKLENNGNTGNGILIIGPKKYLLGFKKTKIRKTFQVKSEPISIGEFKPASEPHSSSIKQNTCITNK